MHARHHSGAEDVAQSLGRRLRQWRDREGLPLRVVAEHLGVSCATVSCWESGKRFPSGKHIDGLASLTGILPCQFFCQREEGSLALCASRCPAAAAAIRPRED